jgi:NADPH:quinone reductase-like Zn-dependent oxidoreductase
VPGVSGEPGVPGVPEVTNMVIEPAVTRAVSKPDMARTVTGPGVTGTAGGPGAARTGTADWPAPGAPGETMTAVVFARFGPPDVLEPVRVPVPRPGPGEVLVRVAAVSVGRLLDVTARSGSHPFATFTLPHILGAEHAGVVAATGPGAEGFAVGERVAAFPVITCGTCESCLRGYDELCPSLQIIGTHRPGAYAQYAVVPARNLHRVPDGISPAEAAALALAGPVAVSQLGRAGFRPGQWVLVQGASSGLGSVTAALAHHLGARVIATSRVPVKRERLATLGIGAVLDATADGFAGQVREITGGRGADIVIDNLGEPRVWSATMDALAPGGTVVSSGAFLGHQVTVNLQALYTRGQRIIGVRTASLASIPPLWAEAARGFRPVIDRTFPLEDAALAHKYLENDSNAGRVILAVR